MTKDILSFIDSQELKLAFDELAKDHGAVAFYNECTFARNILMGNSYLKGVAEKTPESLFSAIKNIASIGLSLNPATAHAYLVPRKGSVCLDISYRGMMHVAQETGSISWAEAKIVYEKDEFLMGNIGERPTFKTNPFSKDRGEKLGVFVTAKTHEGDFLTETMTIEEAYEIRNRSEAYKGFLQKGTSCPWVTDENEMIKKTVVKRASKMWPKSKRTARFDKAIEVENEANGIDFQKEIEESKRAREQEEAENYKLKYEQLDIITKLSAQLTEGMDKEGKTKFLIKDLGVRNFKDLEKLTSIKLEMMISDLQDRVDLLPKKEDTKEEKAKEKPKNVSEVTFKLEVENEVK